MNRICDGQGRRGVRILMRRAIAFAALSSTLSPGMAAHGADQFALSAEGALPAASALTDRSDFILTGYAGQGGVMRGTVPQGTTHLSLNGMEIPFAPDGAFLIAFDRDAGMEAKLKAELADGRVIERRLPVAPGDWRLQHVNADFRAGVPDEEFVRRRAVELERIAAARAVHSESDGWKQDFLWPLAGRISGMFGSQRIYRGKPGSFHGGVDVVARTGRPFVAPADGVVVLAADQPFTLEGYLLILDHGMGLNSAFLHCSSLSVKEGDKVRQGQVIGTVGASGRATGPHLHWGMKWNAARIDPARIVAPMAR